MDTIWIVLLTVLAIIGAPLFAIFGAASMLLFYFPPASLWIEVCADQREQTCGREPSCQALAS